MKHFLLAFSLWAITSLSSAATFFVSPNGSDNHAGTGEQPFATLTRARDAIRASGRAGKEDCTVWIADGIYRQSEPLVLGPQDSGSAEHPVLYQGVEGELPRLTNATVVDAKGFKPVTDPAYRNRLSEEIRDKVRVIDLAELGVRNVKAYPDSFQGSGGIFELFVANQRMPIAVYPNQDVKMTMKRVIENGNAANVDSVFEYRAEHHEAHRKWAEVVDHGVWMKGYWRVVWQNEAVRVRSIDTEKRTVTLAGRVVHGIGSKYHRPQGSGGEVYWVLNLLEAIDQPGEWAVDFKDKKLFFYPPENFEDADILISDTKDPLVQIKDASHIELRNLVFEGSLGHGMTIEGGTRNAILGCTVRNIGQYGIVVTGGSEHLVRSCDIYALGGGGVSLAGGDATVDPRVPAKHRVENCDIHQFGEIQRIYAPGVKIDGQRSGKSPAAQASVGMIVRNNAIHNGPHAGVLFSGYDNLFELNEVFQFALVSNDIGAFYSYAKNDAIGNNTFRHNFMHSSSAGDGIYYDNISNGPRIHGNVSYRLGPNAIVKAGKRGCGFLVKNPTKTPITLSNNIAIDCRYGYYIGKGEGLVTKNNLAVACAVNTDVPGLKSYEDDPGFVNLAAMDLRLRSSSKVFSDLDGFEPIPFERIGLHTDQHRSTLPNYRSRFAKWVPGKESLVDYDILDR